MAYNLPLQLSIQAPTAANLNAVKRQIEQSLGGLNIGNIDAKSFAKATSEVNKLSSSLEDGSEKAKTFFDRVEGKARSFAAYTVLF